MPPADVLSTPFLCLGTHEEMARHLLACRARWDISYFTVRDIEASRPSWNWSRRLAGGA